MHLQCLTICSVITPRLSSHILHGCAYLSWDYNLQKKENSKIYISWAKVINHNTDTSVGLTTSGEFIFTLVHCSRKCLILKTGEAPLFPLLQFTLCRVIFTYRLKRVISHLFSCFHSKKGQTSLTASSSGSPRLSQLWTTQGKNWTHETQARMTELI